jgi:dephospho-CoA kinase
MVATIALVGLVASGKGEVVKLLEDRGYSCFSYGTEVAKEIAARGLSRERTVYQDVSDLLRLEFGTDVLARRISSKIDRERRSGGADKALIDGPRHPDELFWLKMHFGTKVLAVSAPVALRMQRFLERARHTDIATAQGFHVIDQRDRGSGQPRHGQQGNACLLLADVVIENTGTIEVLRTQLLGALTTFGANFL